MTPVRPSEKALDQAFRDALHRSSGFVEWLLAQTGFADAQGILVDAQRRHVWYKSPSIGIESETDIFALFERGDGSGRFALHIENKPAHGRFQPRQAELYALRGRELSEKLAYDDFETVLLCPAAILTRYPDESAGFDRVVSYETVAAFVPEFDVGGDMVAMSEARSTVRPAAPDDVAAMLRLVRALAAYEREPDAVQATAAMLHEALFGGDAHVHAHVAEADGRIVGVAIWFLNFSTWTGRPGVYLEDLFVDEAARGTGAGRALLRAVAQAAVARGGVRLDWAVLDWNEPAMGFYRRIGATPAAGWQPWRLEGEALAAFALSRD